MRWSNTVCGSNHFPIPAQIWWDRITVGCGVMSVCSLPMVPRVSSSFLNARLRSQWNGDAVPKTFVVRCLCSMRFARFEKGSDAIVAHCDERAKSSETLLTRLGWERHQLQWARRLSFAFLMIKVSDARRLGCESVCTRRSAS